jgi:hypothetical protein
LFAKDLQWLVSQRRGRRIVWRLLERAGVFRSSFSTDAGVTAFNEGRRYNGNELLVQLVTHSPEQYALMLKEQREYE